MTQAEFELTRLDPNTFEHMVNSLALHVLGAGHTSFGPGPDGGRDGLFEGGSNYPSPADGWSGLWYVQSKFHSPNLSRDHNKWLLTQLEEELKAFDSPESKRKWPDIYILATNIDPTGVPETGVYDQAKKLIKKYRPELFDRFHIWGGAKIISLLSGHEAVAAQYGEFVTAGHVIRNLYKALNDSTANREDVLRHFLVTDFQNQLYSKLEQAGSDEEDKPHLQDIFTDLPYLSPGDSRLAAKSLAKSLAYPQALPDELADMDIWDRWQRDPERARIWFVKGGPGQGKSTVTQFIAQVQRAALILHPDGPSVTPKQKRLAKAVKEIAVNLRLWPLAPRIPVTVELKSYAQWFGEQRDKSTKFLAYLEHSLSLELAQDVLPGTLKRMFSSGRWLFVFDGLDEVPGDIKDKLASEVVHFVDNFLVGIECDASVVCTSRPQGYSGQFDVFQCANVTLSKLSRQKALECAKPILRHKVPEKESAAKIAILEQALSSPSVASLMTTPLQSHIMAIIVRIGGRPPERKWKLFDRFFEVIKKREADKNFPDVRLNKLLRSQSKLIRALHNRLGFELHSRAETKSGATTALSRSDFRVVVTQVVSSLQDREIEETVATLMEAVTERLVLVNTPENGETVRFDIRQLQEFFAAEEIAAAHPVTVAKRLNVILGDSHWAEVVHFLISGFVENERRLEISSAVSALVEIDEGQEGTRDLHRRLAKGGLVLCRLLSEGVLEHDRRVRNQFVNCLSALLTTPEAANYLTTTSGEYSRAWLIDLLLRHLRESSEEEAVGAAATLVEMLGDGDQSVTEAFDLISTKSTQFLTAALRQIHHPEEDGQVPDWVGLLAYEALRRDDWTEITDEGIRTLSSIIADASRARKFLSNYVGVETAEILTQLLDFRFVGRPEPGSKEVICAGKIEIHYVDNKGVTDWSLWPSDVFSKLLSTGGYFSAISAACEFLNSPNQWSYEALFEIGNGLDWMSKLPDVLYRAFNKQEISVASKVDNPFCIISESTDAGKLHAIYQLNIAALSGEDWVDILNKIPEHFYHLIAFGDRYPTDLWSSQVFLDKIRSFGSVEMAAIFPLLPAKISEELRSIVLARIVELESENIGEPLYIRKVSPFELRLPDEAPLLPWVVNVVAERANMNIVMPDEVTSSEEIARIVRVYVPDGKKLGEISSTSSFSTQTRAAAALLSAFHPDPVDFLADGDWIEWYTSISSSWLMPAIFHANTPKIRLQNHRAMSKLSTILSLARRDYSHKFNISPVIMSWRELAYQPVAASDAELWRVVTE